MQQVDLGTLLEGSIGGHVQTEASQPVDQRPGSSGITALQDHVEESSPVTRVLRGKTIGEDLPHNRESIFPDLSPLIHAGIRYRIDQSAKNFCSSTVLVLVTTVFKDSLESLPGFPRM